MALYVGSPASRAFGEFVAAAGGTMLGVVPKLVAAGRRGAPPGPRAPPRPPRPLLDAGARPRLLPPRRVRPARGPRRGRPRPALPRPLHGAPQLRPSRGVLRGDAAGAE